MLEQVLGKQRREKEAPARNRQDHVAVEALTSEQSEGQSAKAEKRFSKADLDLVALGIAIAAIMLFIATGGSVMPAVVLSLMGQGDTPNQLLSNAMLLNIALIIFGWRRYKELQREIKERRRAEEIARELSETDPLTRCLNRRSMDTASRRLRERAAENGEAIAYAMIDVDNFKQINDMKGHSVGDAVLVMLADRVRMELPRDAVFARLGGDEFAFAMAYNPTLSRRVDEQIIRIYQACASPFEVEGAVVDVSISVGVATDEADAEGASKAYACEELMKNSDIAMYHAKKQGKNRFFWFEKSMETELRFRNELENGIREGLTRGEFVPYYEQQVDLETGDLVGFEMLARWLSPKLGLVSPEIFIPIAEEIGVISEMSDQLMDRAFTDARDWNEAITLSINISPVQLRDPWFAQKVLKLLVQKNFPPQRLDIEITESSLHENISVVRSMITSLRNQGVLISLDDFGTGYSSLEQLRSLPFDKLKIDRSFISELSNAKNGSRIVDAIVSLGRGLDLPITAEGIEDETILEALKKMGKLKGQGYLYGKPETAAEVRERLAVLGLLSDQSGDKAPSSKALEAGKEAKASKPAIAPDRIKAAFASSPVGKAASAASATIDAAPIGPQIKRSAGS